MTVSANDYVYVGIDHATKAMTFRDKYFKLNYQHKTRFYYIAQPLDDNWVGWSKEHGITLHHDLPADMILALWLCARQQGFLPTT